MSLHGYRKINLTAGVNIQEINHRYIKNPVIQGVGYGDLKKGFPGLKDAAYDALKNAVREYYRAIIKNKPKEITGSVLIRDIPTIGISSGRYIFNLDFFLECGKIIEYSVY